MFKAGISQFFLSMILITVLGLSTALAQNELSPASPFTPTKWSKSVDLIEVKLKQTEWTGDKIDNTLAVLQDLQKNARECIHYSQAELDKINLALSQSTANPNQNQQLIAASLNEKEIELNDLRAECRLFLLHSQDIYSQVEKLQEHFIASQIFSRSASIFENISNTPAWQTISSEMDVSLLKQKWGLPYFTTASFLMMGLLFASSFFVGRIFYLWSIKQLSGLKRESLPYAFLSVLAEYAYILTFTFTYSIYFILFSWPNCFTFLGQVSSIIFLYFLMLAFISMSFCPPKDAKALIVLPKPVPEILKHRLFYLLTLILGYYLCSAFFQGFNLPVTLFAVGMTLYLSLLSISVISIVWLMMSFPKFLSLNKYSRLALNIFFTAILATDLISEYWGFHYFAIFLIRNIARSFILICLAWGLQIFIVKQIKCLDENNNLRYYLGVRISRPITELMILQGVLLVLVWSGLVAILLKSWALSEGYDSQLMLAVSDGFTVAGITLVPSRIMLAMFIFVFLSLGNRFLQVYISRRSRYYIEEGTQVATASIIGYAGFALAGIITLVIAGVNFTGLAIIAGALSVGIGFGLQNIANNFISGLILLLDNPIRPGDRIQVGDIEGIVKRIRLRATHIYTLRHADVFIPNSELISKSVTNFVFHDKTWSIVCPVGVEHGCDIRLVKDILLKVAHEHPDVIKDEKKKPQVLFKKITDNNLLFELWCLIQDINKKSTIESDLNSAIYQAFQENHINIPYPQQDVHIKDWPERPYGHEEEKDG